MSLVTTFSPTSTVAALSANILDLLAGDTEVRTLLVNGFATGDSITSVKLYAKVDVTDADTDVDTIILTGVLTTPDRDPNARLVTFSLTTDQTIRLLTGRVYAVRAIVVRSATTYTKTIATGFIGAAYPGNTVVAPSDEAALRLAGDATITSLLDNKVDLALGTVTGSRASGAAYANLLTLLDTAGVITNSSTT